MHGHRLILGFLCAAVLSGSARVGARQAAAPQNPAPATAAPASVQPGGRGAFVKSPEVGADRRVTFRLRASNAADVAVIMSGRRLAMQKDDQGVWSVTTGSKGIKFTEQEVPDMGHVWPLWRQKVADMLPRLFVKSPGVS